MPGVSGTDGLQQVRAMLSEDVGYSLNRLNWRFDEIESFCPVRARELKSAGTASDLIRSIERAFRENLNLPGQVLFGRECQKGNSQQLRAVIQFQVGTKLFDWFFNGRTGYRAHFRAHYKCGLGFNNQIVAALVSILNGTLGGTIPGYEVDGNFQVIKETFLEKQFVMKSLVPTITKIWFCGNRMGHGNATVQPCYSGPKLILDADTSWAALFYDNDQDAWLDIKGGFLGRSRPYQVKNPFKRAKELQNTGTA